MTEREEKLIRDNGRMKAALASTETYARDCNFGAWRGYIVNLCRYGLSK